MAPSSVVAIVPAAGAGVRLGAGIPKALVEVEGVAIVRRTIDILSQTHRFDRFIVTAPSDSRPAFEQVLGGVPDVTVIAGGSDRQASVALAVQFLERAMPTLFPGGTILVHDAARCLVDGNVISRCLAARGEARALTAALPVVDACVRADTVGVMTSRIDRAGLFLVQTPQVFEAGLLAAAHARGESGALDDASLVAPLERVVLVEGDRANIKVTTAEDLAHARLILRGRRTVEYGHGEDGRV